MGSTKSRVQNKPSEGRKDAKREREETERVQEEERQGERQRKREAAPTLWPRLCALALRPSSNHQPPLPNSSISFSLSLARSATLERSPPSSLRLLSPSWDDVSPLLRRSILLSLGARHGSSERQPSAIRIKPREAPRRGERERVENHRRCSRRRNFSNPVSDRDTPSPLLPRFYLIRTRLCPQQLLETMLSKMLPSFHSSSR